MMFMIVYATYSGTSLLMVSHLSLQNTVCCPSYVEEGYERPLEKRTPLFIFTSALSGGLKIERFHCTLKHGVSKIVLAIYSFHA